ncbi:MAG: hypothetical protein ACT4O1_18170 [Gemmatimonadota bacterium]
MYRRSSFLALAITATFTGNALAQAGWDAPTFFSPRPMDDIGIYVFQTDFDSRIVDDATGLKLIWRQSGNLNLGVHAGTADLDDVGNAILLGAEFYGPLTSLTANTGLIMSWGLGAGAVFGDDYIDLSIPLGVSIGVGLGTGGVSLLPYVHPRVSLDVSSVEIGDNEETETNIGLTIDLGLDVNLGDRFIVRAGGSFGDRDAFGAGIALRIPRRVVVR